MEVWRCVFVLLLSSLSVIANVGAHQMERLVNLLTLKECEDLVVALSSSEDDIFKRLDRLSPENNVLSLQPLSKRRLASVYETESECRTALTDWLVENGEEMYYDSLTRALQHIGRTDVAVEVGKNMNQDQSLNLKHFVENYHETVSSFNVPEETNKGNGNNQDKKVALSDLSSKYCEGLTFYRGLALRVRIGPLTVVIPLLEGLSLGFFGTLLALLSLSCIVNHFYGTVPLS
ncbi:hypothetical protein WMY93_028070 [Mugilogobius chulae]|uniref:Death domain-containing protein n=1 Tax=Mugilogobius chulae TaxID=88201 RepID=A0AAW0MZ04_9GOBI